MADVAPSLSHLEIPPPRSSLLTLPAEVRLIIYRYIFGDPSVPTPYHLLRTLEPTAIFSTCKLLRNESSVEYYKWLGRLSDRVNVEGLREPLHFTADASLSLEELGQMVIQWYGECGEAKNHTFDLHHTGKMVAELRKRTEYRMNDLKRI